VSISVEQFDEASAIDRAMAQLTGRSPSTQEQLVSQLINGELVVQAMGAVGATAPAPNDALVQFLNATSLPVSAVDQALGEVSRVRFSTYLARLYGVDAFVRQQAAQNERSVDATMRDLQAAAHISFGPAAAVVLAPAPVPLATQQQPSAPEPEPAAQPAFTPVTTEPRGARIDQLAPRFELPTLDADAVRLTLDELAGKPLVISFWTTWCSYCLLQTPILVDGYVRYASSGVQFIGINVQEDLIPVAAYRDNHRIPYPILLDGDGAVAATFGVSGYPTTYFLDGDGRIRATQIGALTPEQLAINVEQLLGANP
jgi:peroxiredoxin